MADGQATWWDYVKAAFGFRFPVKYLGGVPANKAALIVAAVFAGLFGVAGKPLAAGGVLMVATAFELYYLHLMCSLPAFRSLVRAELLSRADASTAAHAESLLPSLSHEGRLRYEQMSGVCHEIEALLTRRQSDAADTLSDALKAGGLNDVRALYARLLSHQERLQEYLATRSVRELPRQVRDLETELTSRRLAEAVRHSKEQTLDVLRQRAKQIEQMGQMCDLAGAELERLDQHLALLRDQAAAGGDVTALVEQIDSAVAGVNDTTAWLLDSERMLGDTPEETTKADA